MSAAAMMISGMLADGMGISLHSASSIPQSSFALRATEGMASMQSSFGQQGQISFTKASKQASKQASLYFTE